MHCLNSRQHHRLQAGRAAPRAATSLRRAVAPPAADREPAAAAAPAPAPAPAPPSPPPLAPPPQQHQHQQRAPSAADAPANQAVREGAYEFPLVSLQAGKADPEQPPLAQLLAPLLPGASVDVAVAGCGPAGLYLAAQIASRGLSVGLVGPDAPFVNNYGVWMDEFEALGLEGTVERAYADAVCFFGEGHQVRVGRPYGRVARRELRAHLARLCAEAGVRYMAGEVEAAGEDGSTRGATASVVVRPSQPQQQPLRQERQEGEAAAAAAAAEPAGATVVPLSARMVVLASGAAAGRMLAYEQGAPRCAAQTAYGVEADVEGYGDAYDPSAMLFMDFRRHHTGLWEGGARRLAAAAAAEARGGDRRGGKAASSSSSPHGSPPLSHPNAADGMWDCEGEVPSFLYAMPLDDGGEEVASSSSSGGSSNGNSSGNTKPGPTTTTRRVFLEETCLVAKPALPFAVLKRRLQRRLDAMGVRVVRVHEEEWSYIPVGGPLPLGDQPLVAFGAAANLVHPATGFSVSRSLREAPAMADAVVLALGEEKGEGAVRRASRRVWAALWPDERRRQAAFHLFGMELLAQLDLPSTNAFFRTFFALPDRYWRGFLASRLSSGDLVAFALVTFVLAPLSIKARLVRHLLADPAGRYLADKYLGKDKGVVGGGGGGGGRGRGD